MAIQLPIIISGKSYVVAGGVAIYMKKGVTITDEPESWNNDSQWGKTGERHKARAIKIAGVPEGLVTTAFLNYAYAAFLDRTKVGKTVLSGAVTVYDIDNGDSYAINSAGLFAPPNAQFGPGGTMFEQMTWIGIGDVTKLPTDAAFLATIGGTFTPDTTRDESKVSSDIYTAAFGASPYDALGSIDGFKFKFGYTVKLFPAGDVGYGDAKLLDVSLGVSWMVSNLTQAQVMTLRKLQGASAILPGQLYAKTTTDFVVTGQQLGWVFTAKNMGPKKMDQEFSSENHRHKTIELVNKSASSSGAPSPYFAYTAGS